MSLRESITQIGNKLSSKEEQLDKVLVQSRQIIRACSNAIKAMHSHEIPQAKEYLKQAEVELDKILTYSNNYPTHLNHILQEYTEARVVLAVIESKKIPGHDELKIPELPYLLGLLDAIGELKREMYECLRHGDKKEAEVYFALMEEIYNELLTLRFSNAILPEFRHKQDSARHQIEQARGELI
ncbi:Translin family protein [Candidatus Bilamarchaeum dharawalense]|uniref:Translin family protein n=1 Tax=Candidatus Bilamarchaeum dharawalense TaxID=2885759 RepID=A0A5E4LQZ9_9ARCH|nr:Translin family protein [Candidatus Bilamarchaeum dharawalense]